MAFTSLPFAITISFLEQIARHNGQLAWIRIHGIKHSTWNECPQGTRHWLAASSIPAQQITHSILLKQPNKTDLHSFQPQNAYRIRRQSNGNTYGSLSLLIPKSSSTLWIIYNNVYIPQNFSIAIQGLHARDLLLCYICRKLLEYLFCTLNFHIKTLSVIII